MSTAIVRCPNCGSVGSRTTRPDEYECSHCGAHFHFVRPLDQVITYDVRAHNCPVCGKAVEAAKGYRCVRCGKFDICESCVDKLNGGYVCKSCIKKEARDCIQCGKYAAWSCVSCEELVKRGINKNTIRCCGDHYYGSFTKYISLNVVGGYTKELSFSCPRCGGQVCVACAIEKKTLLGKKYYCKNCGSELTTKEELRLF